jgi:hypothetical protein
MWGTQISGCRNPGLSDLPAGRWCCARTRGEPTGAEVELPLADPPITLAEALAVDLGRDTTLCRLHRGQYTQLNVDGKVYFCAVGRMYWRYARLASRFLKPLNYGWGFRG